MKRILVAFLVVFLVLSACDTGNNKPSDPIAENPGENPETPGDGPIVEPVDPSNPIDPLPEEVEDDARLVAFGAKSVKWLRRPVTSREVVFNIADGDPIAAYCTEPGWAYIFYNDQAVIGYEPFPDRIDVMHRAVEITVVSHNLEKPNEEWGYINVPPIAPPPPITTNDPILGKWQYALCLDTGEVVAGPYTAEYDFEWQMWKEGVVRLTCELYNRDNDPDAHIVWGTEE